MAAEKPLPYGRGSIFLLLAWASLGFAEGDLIRVTSPNGQIEFRLMVSQPSTEFALPRVAYQVYFQGKRLIDTSYLGYEIEDPVPLLGENVGLSASKFDTFDETYTVPAGKTRTIRNHYNSLLAEYLQNGSLGRRLNVEVRAYDDGVTFRLAIPFTTPTPEVRVDSEESEFNFAKDGDAYPLILRNFQTNYEDQYSRVTLSGIHPESVVGLPFLVEQPGIGFVAVNEAHLENYAGMYLRHAGGTKMISTLSPRPDQPSLAVYSKTPLVSPWRVLMIGTDPGRFIESNLVMNLNPPSTIADTSWIKPGKAAWNAWSGAPATTVALKQYIDFAAESRFEYVLAGPGWAAVDGNLPPDITKTAPDVDLPELLSYAKSKHVGVWLSLDWSSLERQMEEAFPLFEKWGVAGVYVDGINRDDQWMIGFYRRVIQKAAEHRLLVDFHGAFKPDGINRTYPNAITQGAVLGLEYFKTSARPNPPHDAMLPFTRMLAGPMDYTPGGFDNVTAAEFAPRELRPMVLGTRAHQLALYVVFESPFQTVADRPEAYRGQKEFDFIKAVPATWEETHFLSGRVGEYVAVARRSGSEWYAAAITDWTPRALELPLGFLGKGNYVAEIYEDASDAGLNPKHTASEQQRVNASTLLRINMASGGGVAIRFRPVN
jgi:alpha-glucosidase